MGVKIHRGVVPETAVTAALRLIWDDLMRRGLLPDEVANYRRSSDWFPWLKNRPEIVALRDHAASAVDVAGLAPQTPQIVFQPPDEHDGRLDPHVDHTDEGGVFARIAAVALTEQNLSNGGLAWWDDRKATAVEAMQPGDVLELPPTVPHASGANATGMPRVAAYFRWL